MSKGRFTPETAAKAGRKGGLASQARRRKVSLAQVEKDLPPMDSIENIIRRLETISVWTAAGLVTGSHANALVRATEVGLKALEQQLATEDVEAMRRKLDEVEAELRRRELGLAE